MRIDDNAYHTRYFFHNNERWFGAGATLASLTGYSLISGNNAFGAETLMLDVANTPINPLMRFFDIHKIFITELSSVTAYMVRLLYGTGTCAEAETAGQYSDIPILTTGLGSNVRGEPSSVVHIIVASGTKIWGKCKNATNLATMNILIGLHEYEW
jgi:hypothetical protein